MRSGFIQFRRTRSRYGSHSDWTWNGDHCMIRNAKFPGVIRRRKTCIICNVCSDKKNLQRTVFVVADNSRNHAVLSVEVQLFKPVVLISGQLTICGNVTGQFATLEFPLSISTTVATSHTAEKMVAFTLEGHGLVKGMHEVLLKLCAMPWLRVHRTGPWGQWGRVVYWVGLALEIPDSVRIIRAVVTRHTSNWFTLGTLNIEIFLGIVIPIFSRTCTKKSRCLLHEKFSYVRSV